MDFNCVEEYDGFRFNKMTEVLFMDSRTLSRSLIQPPYSAYILLASVLKKEHYHNIPNEF